MAQIIDDGVIICIFLFARYWIETEIFINLFFFIPFIRPHLTQFLYDALS